MLDYIVSNVPHPTVGSDKEFKMLISMIDKD